MGLSLPDTVKLLANDLGIANITDSQTRQEIRQKIQVEREQKELFEQYEVNAQDVLLRLQSLQRICRESMKQLTPKSLEETDKAMLILLAGNVEILIDALLNTDAKLQLWAVGQGGELLESWEY